MSIYDRYGDGRQTGATPLRTEGYTPEQLAQRDSVLNAPIPQTFFPQSERLLIDPFAEGGGTFVTETPVAPEITLGGYEPRTYDAVTRAFTMDNIVAAAREAAHRNNLFSDEAFPTQEGFNPNDYGHLYDLVSSDYYEMLNEAESEDELIALTQYWGRISRDTAHLDQLGLEGVGYRAAAVLSEVPAYVMAGNLIGAGASITRVGRLANVATATYFRRAGIAGVTEGALEAAKMALDPTTRSELDILLAVGLGGAVGGIYRPLGFSGDVQQAIMNPVAETVTAVAEEGTQQAARGRLGRIIERAQVDVASVLRRSESPTLRNFGDSMFVNFGDAAPTTVKAAEVQSSVISGIQSEFNRRFTPLYSEFLSMTGRTNIGRRYRIAAQDEFYEVVGSIANNPAKNWEEIYDPAFVAKVRQANEEMGQAAYDTLARNGHPLFSNGSIKRGEYLMPRRWNRSKLLEDMNSGRVTKQNLEDLFSQGIRSAIRGLGREITDEKAIEAGKKFVQTLTKAQARVGGGDAGFIMENNAFQRAIEDVADALDLSDAEFRQLDDLLASRRATKSAIEGTAGSTRKRGDIDLDASMETASGTISISDYVENNAQAIWQSYSRQMGGDTALRAAGVNSRTELAQLRNKMIDELKDEGGNLSAGAARDIANFDAVIADMLNISQKTNPESDLWRGTRIVNNLVRASKLGSTWFAMTAELAQTVHVNGVARTLTAMGPVFNGMVRGLKGSRGKELIDEIQGFYNLADEILQMPSANRLDEMLQGSNGTGKIAVMEAVSDRFAEAAYVLGGTKSGTSALEAVFAAGANNKLIKIANRQRLGRADRFYLEQMGFRGEEADLLLRTIRDNADPSNRYVLRLGQWEDQELAQRLAYGVRRISNTTIQRGTIGEQVGRITLGDTLIKDNILGAMAMNLRNYMMTAWSKQTNRMAGQISRGGYEAFNAYKNMVYQGVIVGGLGYMAKTGLDYQTGAIDEETFDERMTPRAIAASTFNMTTFASLLAPVADFGYSTATGETLSGRAARGNEPSLLGASGGYLGDIAGAVGTGAKALDPNRDVTAYELRRALSLLPLSTLVGVKQIIGAASEEIAGD